VIANGENAAGGSGLSISTYEELTDSGIDVVTLGDHAYKHDEVHELIRRGHAICRAANYPPDAPGSDHVCITARDGMRVGVFLVQGRAFMPPVDCPFRAADRMIERLRGEAEVIVVDMHAEATSDKQLMGRYLDGRVTAVFGTHTHVPTADEQIFPGGTAYQTDVGMCGPYQSVIGRRYDRVIAATLLPVPQRFEVARDDSRLCGALIQADIGTGRTQRIWRVCVDEVQAQRLMVDDGFDPLNPPRD
jgi:metallophosphoesterase (TIGR00282 family)